MYISICIYGFSDLYYRSCPDTAAVGLHRCRNMYVSALSELAALRTFRASLLRLGIPLIAAVRP